MFSKMEAALFDHIIPSGAPRACAHGHHRFDANPLYRIADYGLLPSPISVSRTSADSKY
jgi:hypothetical protein